MMVHVFRAKLFGWDNDYDDIIFDASRFSREDAEAYFVEKVGLTNKNNLEFPYSYYEYEGKKYYSYQYMGIQERNLNNSEEF